MSYWELFEWIRIGLGAIWNIDIFSYRSPTDGYKSRHWMAGWEQAGGEEDMMTAVAAMPLHGRRTVVDPTRGGGGRRKEESSPTPTATGGATRSLWLTKETATTTRAADNAKRGGGGGQQTQRIRAIGGWCKTRGWKTMMVQQDGGGQQQRCIVGLLCQGQSIQQSTQCMHSKWVQSVTMWLSDAWLILVMMAGQKKDSHVHMGFQPPNLHVGTPHLHTVAECIWW